MASKSESPFQGNEHDCSYETDPRQNPELAGSLKGKNVVIAGAGRGIGRACAEFLTHASARSLTLVALEQNELEDTAEACRRINDKLLLKIAVADVCDAARAEEILAEVDRDFDGVDVLLMNAGRPPQWLPTAESDPTIWWNTVAVSLQGAFNYSRFVLPIMQRQKGGTIIFTSSVGAHANSGMASYTIGKLGMVRLCEILHQENFKEHNIKVFSYNPGCIRTRFFTDYVDFLDGKPVGGSYLVKGVSGEQKSAETVKNFFTGVTFDTPQLAAGLVTALAAGKLDFMSGRFLDASRHINEYIAEKEATQKQDLHRVKLHLAERFIPTSDF
ncbi:hypothetical protein SEUCBS139899_004637 [Sporothrix eucalyptigena]|uniref:Uncharacterized protein n=1 Tax=Sporothrix eucalyptigena TaxID=1812306 RepID=A0ABP0BPS6_9PEZI